MSKIYITYVDLSLGLWQYSTLWQFPNSWSLGLSKMASITIQLPISTKLFLFGLLISSYFASAELIPAQDNSNQNLQDGSPNLRGPDHCEAMLVSLNPFHCKHSFEASKAKLSLIYLACLLLCQLPDINLNPGPIAKGR